MLNWLRRLMYGRYGSDQLCYGLLGVSLFLLLLERMTHWYLLGTLSFLLLVVCYLRMFSRNISRRYEENQKFLRLWSPIEANLRSFWRMLSGSSTYRFFKCPSCGQKVRVPKNRGKISITCPKCGLSFIKKT